jgi:8-oxo-dGTP diphosphatase
MKAPANSVAGIAAEGGRLFIARRSPGGDIGAKWEFPGGKVEAGESDEEALVREYREEFGVTVTAGPYLGSASFEHHGKARTLNAYRVFFREMDFTLSEHTEWRWAGFDEIGRLDFAGSDSLLIPQLKAYFQGEARVQDPEGGP